MLCSIMLCRVRASCCAGFGLFQISQLCSEDKEQQYQRRKHRIKTFAHFSNYSIKIKQRRPKRILLHFKVNMRFQLAPTFSPALVVLLLIGDSLATPDPCEKPCDEWPMPNPNDMTEYVNHMNNCCPSPENGPVATDNTCCFVTPPLTRISAEEAFEAYQNQEIDGNTGVVMIDVRTPEEVYWTGQPTQTNFFGTANDEVVPENYKTTLLPGKDATLIFDDSDSSSGWGWGWGWIWGWSSEEWNEHGKQKVKVEDIVEVDMSPIAFNVPVEYRDVTDPSKKDYNPNIGSGIIEVVNELEPEALIYYCRSGKRSSIGCYWGYCSELVFQLMDKTNYEIDGYDDEEQREINGRGGFQGSSFNGRYNGYRGFPNRLNEENDSGSVSWLDTGLPIKVGQSPVTLGTYQEHMKPPFKCLSNADLPICGKLSR